MGESDDLNDSTRSSSPKNDKDRSSYSAKKKRNSNFSKDEIKCLISEYGSKSHSLNFGTRELKQKCWEDITAGINKINVDVVRSVNEVKKKWIDLLYDTKKQYIKATKDAEKAGEPKRRRLNDIAEMIIKVKGGFSKKVPENGNANELRLINFQLPGNDEETNGTPATTFLIPTISDCSDEDTKEAVENQESPHMIISDPSGLNVTGSSNIINTVDHYESYGEPINNGAPTCPCGLGINADMVRLKQESIGLKRRLVQIEEERRLEEKQKWWEEKSFLRLKKQKMELEIKALQASLNLNGAKT